jgi:hypothetical protein
MRRLALPLLAATALGAGAAATPAAGEPPPQACVGGVVSSSVIEFGGRRAVADFFFGPSPRAVQTGQQAVKGFCGI